MDAAGVFRSLVNRGCRLIPDGEHLRVQDPRRALTDDLREAIRQHKVELLALLAPDSAPCPPTAHVGRHGPVCPECGDSWQWPTTAGDWVCASCFVRDPLTAPRFPTEHP